MNSSSFYRCLVISMTTTITAGLVSLLGSFSGLSLHPWSWATVHASMSEVNIVSSQDQLGPIQLAWWGGFVVTVLYLLLSFCLGEETRDIFKWIREKTTRKERFVLPMQCVFFSCRFSKFRSTQYSFLSSSKNIRKRPSTFQLKSGWDDMLDGKVPKTRIKSSITISTCSSPVSEDDDFKTSTLSYLGSPTAKTLGLSGSPVPPNVAEILPTSRTSSPVSPIVHKAADNLVYAPPNSPLPSLPASCYGSRSRSRSPSNLPSEETIGALTPLLSLFPSI
jgi:pheromone a factor receptor